MYTENICHFVPHSTNQDSLHPIHFVLETKPQSNRELKPQSIHKMYLVCEGDGCLHMRGKALALQRGDVFFTFSAVPFAIESKENFSFMYISFIGARGNEIMEKLKITPLNCLFPNCGEMLDIWQKAMAISQNVTDWISEGLLLYTFSFLGNRTLPTEQQKSADVHLAQTMKKLIDDSFSNPDLSLTFIAQQLSYHQKYLSFAFKNYMKIGFVDYLNTVRLQNACTLMDQGFTSVSDIAALCGFSDPQYFSRLFKAKTNLTPTAYMRGQRDGGTTL